MRSAIKASSTLLLIMLVGLAATPASAVVPDGIDYQGYLATPTGTPIDGVVNITFAAYNVDIGGVPLWNDTLAVDVDQGLFSVTLANPVNPFPPGLFDGQVWIGLFVAGETLLPRRPLNSTAYSFKAADADTLTGATASDLDEPSVVEAGIDGVELLHYECEAAPCVADCAAMPDGTVDVADLLALLGQWGQLDAACDTDGDGDIDISDLLELLAAWGSCP